MLNVSLEQKIAQMIVMGFEGCNISAKGVQIIYSHINNYNLGNIILYSHNIENSDQLKNLTSFFKSNNKSILIAVDQEGGRIQRLSAAKGFNNYQTAKEISTNNNITNAKLVYNNLANELKNHGINLNFAPVVDLDSDDSEIIGKLERSFSRDPDIIVKYAEIFIEEHRKHQILTCIKHFPGHGLVQEDSHKTLPDATNTADNKELIPYYQLISQNKVDMIMTAHIINKNLDTQYPATLSPFIIKKLLRDQDYNGVVVSDDLFMTAIVKNYSLKESVILSINAGCDMLIYSNNKKACSSMDNVHANVNVNLEIIEIVKNAIIAGKINISKIDESYQRIMNVKKFL